MQTKRSYNNSVFTEENTDPKIDGIIPYNYKKRREELNTLVKNHITKQQQKLIKKHSYSKIS